MVWGWNKYLEHPLHRMGSLGLVSIFLSFCCGGWLIALYVLGYKMSNHTMPLLMNVFFIIIGLLFFIFGLMSDVLVKTYCIAKEVENRLQTHLFHV